MVETRPTPATPRELADLDVLRALMGDTMDANVALALLRKHGGNLDKTADALLEGKTPDIVDPSIFADLPNLEPLDAPMAGLRTPPRKSPSLFWCFYVGGAFRGTDGWLNGAGIWNVDSVETGERGDRPDEGRGRQGARACAAGVVGGPGDHDVWTEQ